jgi:hypothetical protein
VLLPGGRNQGSGVRSQFATTSSSLTPDSCPLIPLLGCSSATTFLKSSRSRSGSRSLSFCMRFVIDQGQKLFRRLRIALFDGRQDARNLALVGQFTPREATCLAWRPIRAELASSRKSWRPDGSRHWRDMRSLPIGSGLKEQGPMSCALRSHRLRSNDQWKREARAGPRPWEATAKPCPATPASGSGCARPGACCAAARSPTGPWSSTASWRRPSLAASVGAS